MAVQASITLCRSLSPLTFSGAAGAAAGFEALSSDVLDCATIGSFLCLLDEGLGEENAAKMQNLAKRHIDYQKHQEKKMCLKRATGRYGDPGKGEG
jgi:hypothetical protein